MSGFAEYKDLYLFLDDLAQRYSYGYDTKPSINTVSALKSVIKSCFLLPDINVYFRYTGHTPCTDHGNDLSDADKPKIEYDSSWGYYIVLPMEVVIDIQGKYDDEIIQVKTKTRNNLTRTGYYKDIYVSHGKCLSICNTEENTYVYLTEINYLLNPRHAFNNKNASTVHLFPVYASGYTTTEAGSHFTSGPISPTGSAITHPQSDCINFYNLPGYDVGSNKRCVSGICDKDKVGEEKSFGYSKGENNEALPANEYGLFSSANKNIDNLNLAPAPVVIYRTGERDHNNGKIYSHYVTSTTSEGKFYVRVYYTNNTSDIYYLQEGSDYLVKYIRTVGNYCTYGYNYDDYVSVKVSGESGKTTRSGTIGGFLIRYTRSDFQCYIGNIRKSGGYRSGINNDYTVRVIANLTGATQLIKYDYEGYSTDITDALDEESSAARIDRYFASIGKPHSRSNVLITCSAGSFGALASDVGTLNRHNTTMTTDGKSADGLYRYNATYIVGIGNIEETEDKSQTYQYLVNTRWEMQFSGSNMYELEGFSGTLPTFSFQTSDCTIDQLTAGTDGKRIPTDTGYAKYKLYKTTINLQMDLSNTGYGNAPATMGINEKPNYSNYNFHYYVYGLTVYEASLDQHYNHNFTGVDTTGKTHYSSSNYDVYSNFAFDHGNYTNHGYFGGSERKSNRSDKGIGLDITSKCKITNSTPTYEALVLGTYHPEMTN